MLAAASPEGRRPLLRGILDTPRFKSWWLLLFFHSFCGDDSLIVSIQNDKRGLKKYFLLKGNLISFTSLISSVDWFNSFLQTNAAEDPET